MRRILTIQFGLAFKMVAEIDVKAVSVNLACLLNISLPHFNEIESSLFEALDFNIGFSESDFDNSYIAIDTQLGKLWVSDQLKMAKLQKLTSPAIL